MYRIQHEKLLRASVSLVVLALPSFKVSYEFICSLTIMHILHISICWRYNKVGYKYV
ncbi:hypothetical protein AtEden1_Chr5g0144651 [Arabidopsis thaliana]